MSDIISQDLNDSIEEKPTGESLVPGHSRLRPFLLAVLLTALFTGPILVIELIAPRPAWSALPVIVFFVALEATYTTDWLYQPQRRHLSRINYRLAEFIVIALFLRLLSWAVSGGVPPLEVWRGYLLAPLSFFDSTYMIYLLIALLAWERSVHFSSLFMQLSLSASEVDYYSLPRLEQARRFHDRPIDRERPAVFAGLVKSWLGGGLLLVLFAALTTVDLPTLDLARGVRTINRLGLRPEMLAALLIYFLLGLWLISQGRLAMVRSRWLAEGTMSRPGVIATWRRTSLTLLLLVALVAAFLPIGSTFAIAAVLRAIVAALFFVVQLLFLALTLLFVTLVSLLGIEQQAEEEMELVPQQPEFPTLAPQDTPMSETSALLAGGFFWLLVVAVVVIALAFFLRDRGYGLEQFGALKMWWQSLQAWLGRFFGGAARQATTLRQSLSTRLRALRPDAGGARTPWRFFRINALPPRQQVRYFYLSTVRRAEEKGVPRGGSETPVEYAQHLKENWPEAGEEIEALTGAFLEARYSRRDFEVEEVNPVKAIWRRVRSALRRSRHPDEAEPDDE
ncbi:MAG TPA: DUF4129 domain-containing protein [Candidatus Sulfomarinibacteraceae bacterium]|nr:DUF4129 domain-containing protein [Candidatus Sulfomarinibacteraceae bacterium]